MGAFTRFKAWLDGWQFWPIKTYGQWMLRYADEIWQFQPGLSIGATYEPDPMGAPGVFYPAGGVTGDKDGEIFLSDDLAPAQAWIWQNGTWNPLTSAGGGGPTSIDLFPKYDEDADDAGLYREITNQPFPTAVIWWTDGTKVTKVKELLITRDGNQNPTAIVWKFYKLGILQKTYTDSITYAPGTILETSRTRSIV